MERFGRILTIGAIVGSFGWLGFWIGGPKGNWGAWELSGSNFFLGRNLEDLSRSSSFFAGRTPSDALVLPPHFPEGVSLLEHHELRQGPVSGGVFSVDLSDRAKVIGFYRSLLLREGWHEIPAAALSASEAREAAQESGDALLVYESRAGTFFLGSETVGSEVRFVTTRVPREGR
ncbi:MAG: hypothetical protein M5U26_15560 [Planctomycetota bacterium]|nr:hypothetical protein [Planctomycetota bacterium]